MPTFIGNDVEAQRAVARQNLGLYTTLPFFQWPNDGGGHQMTDVGIDRNGVLYGVTFDRGYVCHPQTAQCWNLGTLPGTYNGLTWIPAGTLDPNKDSLIGISNPGAWTHLKINMGMIMSMVLGSYGPGYSSAGDAFSIEGVGTFAAVNKNGVNGTVIVTVDRLNGKVTFNDSDRYEYPDYDRNP